MKKVRGSTFLSLILYALSPALSEASAGSENFGGSDAKAPPLIGIQPVGLEVSKLRFAWPENNRGNLSMHISSSLTAELRKCGLENVAVSPEEQLQDHPTKKYMLASAKSKSDFRNNEDYFLRFALTKESQLVTATEGQGSLEVQLMGAITSVRIGKTKLLYSERLSDSRVGAWKPNFPICGIAFCFPDPTLTPTDPQVFGSSLQSLSSNAARQLGQKACKYIQNDFLRTSKRMAAGGR